ncbi:Anthocyanidin 3-O-glucoside 2''-O-glucosyltransferase [Bienertia sinuspersici]
MYPWFAYGHLTSFLHLANKLAQRGHKVSFFLPTKTQRKLSSHNPHPNLITFIPITVPPVDGLPHRAETTNDVPVSSQPRIMDAMNLTRPVIDSQLAHLKPDFVFFDFTEWLPSVARKQSIKTLYYSTMYAIGMAYFSTKARNVPPTHRFTETDLMGPPPDFPCPDIRLRAHEARQLAHICGVEFGGVALLEKLVTSYMECDVVGYKSCREMEGGCCDQNGPDCDYFEKKWNKQVLLTGPVIPQPPSTSSELDGY